MRFGVELEFRGISPDALPALPPGWHYAEETFFDGMEAVSPIFTSIELARPALVHVCAALRQAGARTTRRDGLHVHLDADVLGLAGCQRLVEWYYAELHAFNEMWPERARSMQHDCPLLEHVATRESVAALRPPERCQSCRPPLSTASIERHGTIEARQHPGTLDPDEVISWLSRLYRYAN